MTQFKNNTEMAVVYGRAHEIEALMKIKPGQYDWLITAQSKQDDVYNTPLFVALPQEKPQHAEPVWSVIEQIINEQFVNEIYVAKQAGMHDYVFRLECLGPAIMPMVQGLYHSYLNGTENQPAVTHDDTTVTLDKRDLFDFVRGAIKNAMETDDCKMSQAELWSVANDRTVMVIEKLFPTNKLEQKEAA